MSSNGSYGAVQQSAPSNGNAHGDDEQQSLLGGRKQAPSVRKHLVAEINREWADVVLLLSYITTGLLDSAAISAWGSFVSMQTGPADESGMAGNTVYLGLGLAAPNESTRWIKSGTSLAAFCFGSFVFSRFHRFFSPKRRWVLCASFAIQMLFCVAAATILTLSPKAGKDDLGWYVLVPIALIAFQSCGQAVTSRALKYNALTSVVLTSIYCDLFSDQDLFALRNVERNRRAAAPILLLAGAIIGGVLAHSSVGVEGALWMAAALKLIVVVTWFFWPSESSN